jgi:hypothetical protein
MLVLSWHRVRAIASETQRPSNIMPQQQTGKALLSVHRAFVVHFRISTSIAQGRIEGRAEHVVSGQAAHFASLEELLAFIARMLTMVRAPPLRRP